MGLATAYRLLQARPGLKVTILEKEARLATHQTGHNSGVVHAGLYYAPGSLKARLCREGKTALEAFCEAHAIPIERTGKLVVAVSEDELPRFAALKERATANGVDGLEEVGAGAHARAGAARGRHPCAVEPGHRHRRLPARGGRLRRRGARPRRDHRDVPRGDRHHRARRRSWW